MESKRGGARPGAGRPRRESPRIPVGVKLEPEDFRDFKLICEKNNRSQASQIAHWIKVEKKVEKSS